MPFLYYGKTWNGKQFPSTNGKNLIRGVIKQINFSYGIYFIWKSMHESISEWWKISCRPRASLWYFVRVESPLWYCCRVYKTVFSNGIFFAISTFARVKKQQLSSPVFFLNPQRMYFFQAFKTDICKASKRSRVGRKTNSKIAPLDNFGPLIWPTQAEFKLSTIVWYYVLFIVYK